MQDPQSCTGDSCTPGEQASPATAHASLVLTIDIVSDVICPWCWIGKRRLEKALTLLGDASGIRVVWRPFQLNPQMPPKGMERRAYRIAKFGSWEQSQAKDAQVAAAGAEEGITFAFEKMKRTPNTLDAHRLIWLAGQRGVQDAVVERLFRGYFVEGLDLNDRQVLVRLAVEGSVSTGDVEQLLAGEDGRAEVLVEEAKYKSVGVSGVPSFFFNGQPGFSGAVAPAMLAEAILQMMVAR